MRPVAVPPANRLNPYVDEDAVRLLRDPEADPYDLTYALERLSLLAPAEALEVALRCSKHHNAVVREGLVYGLGTLYELPQARQLLTTMSQEDEDEVIRSIAREALE